MEINILELRKKPMINFSVGYQWMQKMTNEELTQWESELIEEIKKSIESEGRYIKQEEINFRVLKEASFIDNDYRLLDQGL
jgi:hypothetical protein